MISTLSISVYNNCPHKTGGCNPWQPNAVTMWAFRTIVWGGYYMTTATTAPLRTRRERDSSNRTSTAFWATPPHNALLHNPICVKITRRTPKLTRLPKIRPISGISSCEHWITTVLVRKKVCKNMDVYKKSNTYSVLKPLQVFQGMEYCCLVLYCNVMHDDEQCWCWVSLVTVIHLATATYTWNILSNLS